DGKFSLNSRAIDLFFVAGMSSFLATLLLVIVVWAVRNKVF
ncbi:putative membrane protein, partial [Acinetobacter baumannii 6112]